MRSAQMKWNDSGWKWGVSDTNVDDDASHVAK